MATDMSLKLEANPGDVNDVVKRMVDASLTTMRSSYNEVVKICSKPFQMSQAGAMFHCVLSERYKSKVFSCCGGLLRMCCLLASGTATMRASQPTGTATKLSPTHTDTNNPASQPMREP